MGFLEPAVVAKITLLTLKRSVSVDLTKLYPSTRLIVEPHAAKGQQNLETKTCLDCQCQTVTTFRRPSCDLRLPQ